MLGLLPLVLLDPDPFQQAFTPAERAILAAPDRVVLQRMEGGFMVPRQKGARPMATTSRIVTGHKALDAVSAIRSGLSLPATPMKCFNPRLRVTALQGNASVSVLICFECQQIQTPRGIRPFSPKAGPLFDRLLK